MHVTKDLPDFQFQQGIMCAVQRFYLWERQQRKNPALPDMMSQLCSTFTNTTYFAMRQQWILRNLTTKQLVRSEAIALSPDYIHGPCIDVIGFGEVVVSRICWSSSSSISMGDTINISRGVWAGHCFDITTLSRHEAERDAAEWSDVSDEVVKEIAGIWESEYGVEWRDIACKDWHHRHASTLTLDSS